MNIDDFPVSVRPMIQTRRRTNMIEIVRGTFSYLRLGVHAEETMSIETAAWILNAGAGIPDGNGDGSCFVSDSGARFWWVDDRFIRKQHE